MKYNYIESIIALNEKKYFLSYVTLEKIFLKVSLLLKNVIMETCNKFFVAQMKKILSMLCQ